MSLLTIIQSVCKQLGLDAPSDAVSSTNLNVIQLVALANKEGQELAQRNKFGWQALMTEATFITVAAENQGLLSTIAPNMKFIVNDTIWNRDLRRPVFGPLAVQRWQQLKAMQMVGPWDQFRIRAGRIIFIPVPPAGQTCAFEYVTRNWCTDSTGVTGRNAFTQNADMSLLDEDLIALGTLWRFKNAKGLDYSEDFNSYERQVVDAIAADGTKDVLNMGDVRYDIFPGILVPSGSWPL